MIPCGAVARACGSCSLCCTLLRVDELGVAAGRRCHHQRVGPHPCGIYEGRPAICRAYRCLWLGGGLRDDDRPDRLGALLDLRAEGPVVRLEIRELERGHFERSLRLQEIAAQYRESMPVRITDVDDLWNPDRPFRVPLAGGEENRVRGDRVEVYRDGRHVETRRLFAARTPTPGVGILAAVLRSPSRARAWSGRP